MKESLSWWPENLRKLWAELRNSSKAVHFSRDSGLGQKKMNARKGIKTLL